jgi:hypothetical protein
LSRTLDIDVEHQVFALGDGPVEDAAMRPVVVLTEHERMLQELAVCQPLLELFARYVMVMLPVLFLSSRLPRRVGD